MQKKRRWLFVAASSLVIAGLLWTQTGEGQGATPQRKLGKIAGPGLPAGQQPVRVLKPLPVLSLPHLTVAAPLVPGPAAFGRGLRIVGQHFGARADRKVRIARADGSAVYFPRIDRWSDTEIVVTLASGQAAQLGFTGSFSGDNPPHASCQVTITTAAGAALANQLALEVFAAAPLGAHDADGDGAKSYAHGGVDCDDGDAARYPGAVEVCDPAGRDEDCDPSTVGARDLDGDGFTSCECTNTDGSGAVHTDRACDCNDMNGGAHFGLADSCDGADNDCDGAIDEMAGILLYRDADGDGYGSGAPSVRRCALGDGASALGTDCNDADSKLYPGKGCP